MLLSCSDENNDCNLIERLSDFSGESLLDFKENTKEVKDI